MSYYENQHLNLQRADRGSKVKELQGDLKKLGYDIGKADGIFGPRTEKAVESFQETNLVNGVVNHETAVAIHSKVDKVVAPVSLPEIQFIASPNFSSRKGRDINLLVIHFTASGTLDNTVRWFENPTANASAHYIIGKNGKIVQMVQEKNKAWHAGKSQWSGVKNCNDFSIGIEMVNWGALKKKGGRFFCWPDNYSKEYKGLKPLKTENNFWEPYTDKQYETLIALSRGIIQRHNISLRRIVGHCDIAPKRKVDPGPYFDWEKFKGSLAL